MAEGKVTQPYGKAPERKPWWQWFLLYPTFGVAVVSATPVLADKALAVYHGTNTDTYSAAVRQRDMWARNLECAASPFAWYSNPNNVRVDATVCPSGDLFVRAMTPDDRSFYHWVALEDVVAPPAAPDGGLIPAAKASSRTRQSTPAPASPGAARIRLAQAFGQVLCQRPVNPRIMLRRLQTPQGCFDEYVDMYSGQVVDRRPAPCVPQC